MVKKRNDIKKTLVRENRENKPIFTIEVIFFLYKKNISEKIIKKIRIKGKIIENK